MKEVFRGASASGAPEICFLGQKVMAILPAYSSSLETEELGPRFRAEGFGIWRCLALPQ